MFLLNMGLMSISSQPVVFLCMRVLVVVWRPVPMDSLVMAPLNNASNVSFEPRYFLRIREYREYV